MCLRARVYVFMGVFSCVYECVCMWVFVCACSEEKSACLLCDSLLSKKMPSRSHCGDVLMTLVTGNEAKMNTELVDGNDEWLSNPRRLHCHVHLSPRSLAWLPSNGLLFALQPAKPQEIRRKSLPNKL